ncbi:hypothetical protein JCM6882_007945 [Rhodosporidiobolus microsporus]
MTIGPYDLFGGDDGEFGLAAMELETEDASSLTNEIVAAAAVFKAREILGGLGVAAADRAIIIKGLSHIDSEEVKKQVRQHTDKAIRPDCY